jgi:hypothetical protein
VIIDIQKILDHEMEEQCIDTEVVGTTTTIADKRKPGSLEDAIRKIPQLKKDVSALPNDSEYARELIRRVDDLDDMMGDLKSLIDDQGTAIAEIEKNIKQ